MQMKHLLVALMVLLALVGTAAAANSLEVRSEVMQYSGAFAAPTITAKNWAGFYYSIDDDLATENITLTKSGTNKLNITYDTVPRFQHYDFDGWYNTSAALGDPDDYGYAVIGFFAEPYVALGKSSTSSDAVALNPPSGVKANKLAKLIMDDDEKYTLKTGAELALGEGYSLIVDQIDVAGNKAYIKLLKDGQEVNSSIVNSNNTSTNPYESSTWILSKDVLGEKSMQVMRIHVKDVFQGTESSLVEIDGIWMTDYQNAIEVKADDKYGKFEATSVGSGALQFIAENISLSEGKIEIGNGIFIKVQEDFDPTSSTESRFYLYKEYTTPGTYTLRSSIFDYTYATTAGTPQLFNFSYTNFSAFYYDIDDDIFTENLNATVTTAGSPANYTIKKGELTYNTQAKATSYAYDWQWNDSGTMKDETFYIMGLFGEKYVPLNTVNESGHTTGLKGNKMAKLVIDDDTKYTLKTGATLELGDGYSIIVDQIDVAGNKAYLRFYHDGQEINSSIVNTNNSTSNWILRNSILGESNVQTFRVHVKDVFQGTQDSLVEIDGLWLMDYLNATEVKSGDKYDALECDGFDSSTNTLYFNSTADIKMVSDMNKLVANNMYLRTADNTSLTNAYFYVNMTIDGEGPEQPPETDVQNPETPETPTPETPTPETPKPETPNTPEPPEKTFWQKYGLYIVIAIILIIIIAAAAYYFLVMKKQ
jgi:S-layer-related duplication domain